MPNTAALSKWDYRFLDLADRVAAWSKDPSSRVGAVLAVGHQVLALGFNGYPSGLGEPSTDTPRDVKLARMIHAEMNAVLHLRERMPPGATMYTTLPCCDRCTAHLIQLGVRRFVTLAPSAAFVARWRISLIHASTMRQEVGARYIEVDLGGQDGQ